MWILRHHNLRRTIDEFASRISLDTSETTFLSFLPSGTFDFPSPTSLTLKLALSRRTIPQHRCVDEEDPRPLVEVVSDTEDWKENPTLQVSQEKLFRGGKFEISRSGLGRRLTIGAALWLEIIVSVGG